MNLNKEILVSLIDEITDSQTPTKNYKKEIGIQLRLAIELYKRFNREVELENIYIINGSSFELDIFIPEEKIGVELKYVLNNKNFNSWGMRTQSSSNGRKHDFLKDCERLQVLKDKGEINKGFAFLITNSESLSKDGKRGKIAPFNLPHNKVFEAKSHDVSMLSHNSKTYTTIELIQPIQLEWFYKEKSFKILAVEI